MTMAAKALALPDRLLHECVLADIGLCKLQGDRTRSCRQRARYPEILRIEAVCGGDNECEVTMETSVIVNHYRNGAREGNLL